MSNSSTRAKVLMSLSGSELARWIRTGKTSSCEMVELYIAKITEVNPHINAMVKDRFEEARKEAEEADKLIEKYRRLSPTTPTSPHPQPTPYRDEPEVRLGILHGVPCTIKECIALTGMPQTSGLVSRKGVIATEDAPVVRRLREAGAIPLGVTNTSELCMWMESHNNLYGRTNNPYDQSRIAGGSSGGEGSIIGAGASLFGIGSDIGGSIRMPAFFNGVFGHKPSAGLVPNEGQYPCATGEALKYLTTGPLCRKAEDLWPLLRLMAGPDKNNGPHGCSEELYAKFLTTDPSNVILKGLKVLSVEELGGWHAAKTSPELRRAQRQVADFLEENGAHVERVRSLPDLSEGVHFWSAMLQAAGGPTFTELMANGDPQFSAWKEIAKSIVGQSDFTLPGLGLCLLERVADRFVPKKTTEAYIEMGKRLKHEIAERIGHQGGIMLFPPHPTTAPKHQRPLLRPVNWIYTAIFNSLELPVTQVPLGLDESGLPLGVQVVSTSGNDYLTIGVAMLLEKEFGGWVPPPNL